MGIPEILTSTVNGRPKVVTLSLYLTPEEFMRPGIKMVSLVRRNQYGANENRSLEIEINRDTREGDIYTFEKVGDYLDNGDYQTINVVIRQTSNAHPQQNYNTVFNAMNLPAYSNNPHQPSMPMQPSTSVQPPSYFHNAPPAPMPVVPMPFNQLGNSNSPFQQLKVGRSGDSDISYLSNGDVAVQLRIGLNDFSRNDLVFRRILADGSTLKIEAIDMSVIGVPEYKPNFFRPVPGSSLTGNMHILIISDIRPSFNCSSLACCA